jgi:hypothetical protein
MHVNVSWHARNPSMSDYTYPPKQSWRSPFPFLNVSSWGRYCYVAEARLCIHLLRFQPEANSLGRTPILANEVQAAGPA